MPVEQRVIPFMELPEDIREAQREKANWKANGIDGSWCEVVDPKYGTISHVAVVDSEGNFLYDKVNLQWTPGAFVLPVRINPKKRAEFLLSREKRILLRDIQNQQGNTFVENILQGLIKVHENELPAQAAIRETVEETGYTPIGLVKLGDVGFDIANSEVLMPFFLALIPYEQKAREQQLDPTEQIDKGTWYTWQEFEAKGSIDAKTLSAFMLARRVLSPKLLKDERRIDKWIAKLKQRLQSRKIRFHK